MPYTIPSELKNDAETRKLVEQIHKEEAEREKLKKEIKERQEKKKEITKTIAGICAKKMKGRGG